MRGRSPGSASQVPSESDEDFDTASVASTKPSTAGGKSTNQQKRRRSTGNVNGSPAAPKESKRASSAPSPWTPARGTCHICGSPATCRAKTDPADDDKSTRPNACSRHAAWYANKFVGLPFPQVGIIYNTDEEAKRQIDLDVEGNRQELDPKDVRSKDVAHDMVFHQCSLLTDADISYETSKLLRKYSMKDVPENVRPNVFGEPTKYHVFPYMPEKPYPIWQKGFSTPIECEKVVMTAFKQCLPCQANKVFEFAAEKQNEQLSITKSEDLILTVSLDDVIAAASDGSYKGGPKPSLMLPPAPKGRSASIPADSPSKNVLDNDSLASLGQSQTQAQAPPSVDALDLTRDAGADSAAWPDVDAVEYASTSSVSGSSNASPVPRSLSNDDLLPDSGSLPESVVAEVRKITASLDLWKEMVDGFVPGKKQRISGATQRHQARMASKRMKEKGFQDASNVVENWVSVHEEAGILSPEKINIENCSKVNAAVDAMLKEFDCLPSQVVDRLVTKSLDQQTRPDSLAFLKHNAEDAKKLADDVNPFQHPDDSNPLDFKALQNRKLPEQAARLANFMQYGVKRTLKIGISEGG